METICQIQCRILPRHRHHLPTYLPGRRAVMRLSAVTGSANTSMGTNMGTVASPRNKSVDWGQAVIGAVGVTLGAVGKSLVSSAMRSIRGSRPTSSQFNGSTERILSAIAGLDERVRQHGERLARLEARATD